MATNTSDAGLHRVPPRVFRKKHIFTLLAAGLLLITMGHVHAEGNVADGKVKARACQVCHGKGGKSTNDSYPVLSGQHAAYIRKQLHAFRDGTRKDPIMNGMAAPLSDKDIEDVAAYFNSTK